MITQIRRPYWIAAHLVLLAAAAYCAAATVSTIARARLRRAAATGAGVASATARTSQARPIGDYLAIAKRDLFAAPAPDEAARTPDSARQGPANLKLVGTGRSGKRRYAIIEDVPAKKQDVYRIGDKIGDAEVIRVEYRRIVLRRAGQEEVLQVSSEAGDKPGIPATTAGAAASPAGGEPIKKLADDKYLVARAEVDHSMENLSELFTQMRAVPNMDNGKTNGFRVFSIRQGSLFEKLGLSNNDVVQRVNGSELTDPARAMGLLQELQGQTRLTVDVLRNGEARTLSYEIR